MNVQFHTTVTLAPDRGEWSTVLQTGKKPLPLSVWVYPIRQCGHGSQEGNLCCCLEWNSLSFEPRAKSIYCPSYSSSVIVSLYSILFNRFKMSQVLDSINHHFIFSGLSLPQASYLFLTFIYVLCLGEAQFYPTFEPYGCQEIEKERWQKEHGIDEFLFTDPHKT